MHTWTELDTGALRRNLERIARELGGVQRLIHVVKADAYGHGLREVAACARTCGVQRFAVAHLEEAVRLRECVPDAWVLLLGVLPRGQVPAALALDIAAVVVSVEHGEALSAAAQAGGARLRAHIKIDTGMGRLGLPWQEAETALARLRALPGLRIEGLCTHSATSPAADRAYSELQRTRFAGVRDARGIPTDWLCHAANSAAFGLDPAWRFDAVRIGLLAYGYGGEGASAGLQTEPALHWKTRVAQVKALRAGESVGYDCRYRATGDERIAVLDVGYADGFPRAASERAEVLLGGHRAPVRGRVSMNLTTVGVPAGVEPVTGDEAVLVGCQGAGRIGADELATHCGTIAYEILTGIRAVERHVRASDFLRQG